METKKKHKGKRNWLPMPYREGSAKISLAEWKDYRRRQAAYLKQNPKYAAGWGRPTIQTAEKVWELLAPSLNIQLEDLFPRLKLPPEYQPELAITAKQALLVVLDRCVCAGHEDWIITFNDIFDALATRWSDSFRFANALKVSDMKRETVKAARRDLLRNGLRLKTLWEVAVRKTPWAAKRNSLYDMVRTENGYQVDLRKSKALVQFEDLVRLDSDYRRPYQGSQILLADESAPQPKLRQRICAERPYNVVRLGPRSKQLIARQEQVRLRFNADDFQWDYIKTKRQAERLRTLMKREYKIDPKLSNQRRRYRSGKDGRFHYTVSKRQKQIYKQQLPKKKWDKARSRLAEYDRLRGLTANFAAVYEGVAVYEEGKPINLPEDLPIKNRFYRTVNRRYQPAYFWPLYVTAKPLPWEGDEEDEEETELPLSLRERWFRSEFGWFETEFASKTREIRRSLVGVDISSSQTQILAVLLGIKEIEQIAAEKPFKDYLAEELWRLYREGRVMLDAGSRAIKPYKSATDKRLVKLVKTLWMRVLYGSRPEQVALVQYDDPGTYGPGWIVGKPRKGEWGEAIKQAGRNALGFLTSISGYSEVDKFLQACRRVAEVAKRDPCAGVIFTDPFDGATVRWNPVKRKTKDMGSEGQRLIIRPPAGPADAKGDYPVNVSKLKRMVAPCLVHMLDAYFSALVMERLSALGVRNFVGIHDAWLVEEIVKDSHFVNPRADEVLKQAIREASEEWLCGLKPIYDQLIDYLRDDQHSLGADKESTGSFVRRIKAQWERRVQNKDWPRFISAPSN